MEIVIDSETPPNEKLCAKYKKSFAYPTVTERLPVIVTSIIDTLVRDKNELSDECRTESKSVIGELSELKYMLQTAKPIVSFTSSEPDTEQWNKHVERYQNQVNEELTFYNGPWLFVECYLYRRIREIFILSESLKEYDPFGDKKETVLTNSLPVMEPVFEHLLQDNILDTSPLKTTDLIQEFSKLIKLCLWANRVDLSMSSGNTDNCCNQLNIDEWDKYILSDDTEKVLNIIFSPSSPTKGEKIVDYVLDNSGLELLSDLCLADFLVTRCGVDRVRLRVKRIPWFVSDVTTIDLEHTLKVFSESQSQQCRTLGTRWREYIDKGIWTVTGDVYWTLGLSYDEMQEADPGLYSELEKAALIIFKGDLNYRKLIQDTAWAPGTSLSTALGRFHPGPLVAIRTLKADTVAGIESELYNATSSKSPDWLISGQYGLIQFDSYVQ
uniref:Sugar phosphate phosphatase n=1 Tax=Gerris buenoi TaxID=56086 RepID=A0A4U8V9P5_GERBU|nr:protein-glutamate O-methyltransferase [Gerris buenoi]